MGSLVRTQTAIVGTSKGTLELSHTAPVPEIHGDLVLVKTAAISVNPVDAKMMGPYVTEGAISGCDFAGTVEAAGPEAGKFGIRVGDRVCAAIMGQDPLQPDVGAFAQHVAARAPVLMKIPDSVSFAKGAALGTSFMTAGLALFRSLQLPGDPNHPYVNPNPEKPAYVLVYGGATATGTAAIQLLRLAGFVPVVVCSPHSTALVQSYAGSDLLPTEAIFDYHDPDCGAQIRSYTRNNLRHALDCITTPSSMEICYAALSRAGGRYTALDPFSEVQAAKRKIVKADWVLGPVMLGKPIQWPAPHGPRPADADMFAFGTSWTSTVQGLLQKGLIRTHPVLEQPGGFAGALEGMEALRQKTVSGKKLVYKIE